MTNPLKVWYSPGLLWGYRCVNSTPMAKMRSWSPCKNWRYETAALAGDAARRHLLSHACGMYTPSGPCMLPYKHHTGLSLHVGYLGHQSALEMEHGR